MPNFQKGLSSIQDRRNAETITALNELLRGELAAVEIYNQALTVLEAAEVRQDLRECQISHQDRVLRLYSEVLARGGEPADGSDAWGFFKNLAEKGRPIVGPSAAVQALEAGEDHELKEYQQLLPALDLATRGLVSADLYPQQVRTYAIVSALKHALEARPTA